MHPVIQHILRQFVKAVETLGSTSIYNVCISNAFRLLSSRAKKQARSLHALTVKYTYFKSMH